MSTSERPWPPPVTFGALAVVVSLLIWLRVEMAEAVGHLDLRVFYGAVRQLMDGGDLYGFAILDNGVPTPFLYPPFAALAMVPIAALPYPVAAGVWDLLQLTLVIVLLWLVGRGVELSPSRIKRMSMATVSWMLMVVSVPVLAVFQLGQLGLVLAALVLVDVVLIPPKYRGLLTGLAGAIKLIPLLMLPYYLVSRQWRTAAMTVLGFGGATLIGFVALPAESVRYWTEYAFSTGRFPGIGSGRNLSILGLLQYVQAPGATAWWLVAAVVVTVPTLWGAARLYGGGEVALAAILIGVVAGLISPVSWHHHLVWIPVAGAALAYRSWRPARLGGWLILVLASAFAGAAGSLLSQAVGSQLPELIGWLLLQLGVGAVLITVGLRASRSAEFGAERVAP